MGRGEGIQKTENRKQKTENRKRLDSFLRFFLYALKSCIR